MPTSPSLTIWSSTAALSAPACLQEGVASRIFASSLRAETRSPVFQAPTCFFFRFFVSCLVCCECGRKRKRAAEREREKIEKKKRKNLPLRGTRAPSPARRLPLLLRQPQQRRQPWPAAPRRARGPSSRQTASCCARAPRRAGRPSRRRRPRRRWRQRKKKRSRLRLLLPPLLPLETPRRPSRRR